MKIAIFNHPFTDFYTSHARLSPAVPSYLQKFVAPHEVRAFSVLSKKNRPAKMPNELHYLLPYLTGDQSLYSFFSTYLQFGHTAAFDHKSLKRFMPHCILVTSFAYCYFEGFKEQVAYLKRIIPTALVICGGPGPSSCPSYYLAHSDVDIVLKGPAENTLPQLLSHLEQTHNQIKKLPPLPRIFTRYSAPLETSNQNTSKNFTNPVQPFVAIQKNNKIVQLQVTRGCPKKCAYCSIHSNSNGAWQKASIDTVLDELRSLNLPRNIHLDFEDDNLTFDPAYCLRLLTQIKKEFHHATFSAQNGIDFTTLNEPFIEQLIQLGFTSFNLSLTSVSIPTLNHHGRPDYLQKFEKVVSTLCAHKIPTTVYYICGLPKDDVSNILDTLTYLMGLPILIGVSPYYAVPGTPLTQQTPHVAPILSRGSSFHSAGTLNSTQLVTFFLFTRAINFLKSTHNKHWRNKNREPMDMTDRQKRSMDAWTQSVQSQRLTGYSTNNGTVTYLPYPLDNWLSLRLFYIITGKYPLVTQNQEVLDKSLWA